MTTMKASIFLKTILLMVLLNSCSYYFQIQKEQESNNKNLPSLKKNASYCLKQKNKVIYSGSSKKSVENFKLFLRKIKIKKKILFIDQLVLWSLLQMNLRPDLSSPTSRFQGIVFLNGNYIPFDFYAKNSLTDTSYPFLFGLEYLLKKSKSKNSLLELAELIDSDYSWSITISKEMEFFLKTHKNELKSNPFFKEAFFKANHTLQERESLSKLSFVKVVSLYLRSKMAKDNYHSTPHLFSYKPPSFSEFDIQCNQDLNLYDNSIFLISKKKQTSNTYSILSPNGDFFLGVNTQVFSKIKPVKNTFLVSGESIKYKSIFCTIKNKKKCNTLFLFSSAGRDPGQYIYNFIHNSIFKTNSLSELNDVLQGPRHLFLVHPYRVIYESSRANQEQLKSFLLENNLPVYHGNALGKIWGHGQFGNESGMIFDSRRSFYSTCQTISKDKKL